MKIKTDTFTTTGDFCTLKNERWLANQRIAGIAVRDALATLKQLVKDKTNYSTLQLSRIAEDIILSHKCDLTFKGYKGFPECCCISVNDQLVHGIPNSYQLQDGDVVSFDLGATYQGVIADSAITCIYGEPKSLDHVQLIENTEKALYAAIDAIKINKQLGIIGETIYKIGNLNKYGVVTHYSGHGLEPNKPHFFPSVCNKDTSNNGIRFKPGMTIAIEPLFVLGGNNNTRVTNDNWTVITKNISAHAEHTVFIHEDYIEIIT